MTENPNSRYSKRSTRNINPHYAEELKEQTNVDPSEKRRRNTVTSYQEDDEDERDSADFMSEVSNEETNKRKRPSRNVKAKTYNEEKIFSQAYGEDDEVKSNKNSVNSSRRSSVAPTRSHTRRRRNIINDSDDDFEDEKQNDVQQEELDELLDDQIQENTPEIPSAQHTESIETLIRLPKGHIDADLVPDHYNGPNLNIYFFDAMSSSRRKHFKNTFTLGSCDNPYNKHPDYIAQHNLRPHNIKKLPLYFEKVVTQSKSRGRNRFSDQAPPIAPENWAQILEHRSYVAYKVKLPSRAPSDFKPVHPSQIGGLRGHLDIMFNHLVFPFLDETKDDPIVPSNGFLFHGPPGTGKTLLARAVVEMCFPYNPTAFFYIKASDLLSKWVGQTEQMLRDLFKQAQIWSPSIILLDEIDGLAQDRSDNTSAKNKGILSSLLTLMDGLHSTSRVTVIGTTNHLSNLDPALRRPGRFDHELEFQLPDLEARLAIITLSTTNMVHPPDPEMLREVATRLSGYSGADITKLCNVSKQCAIDRTFPDIVRGKNLDSTSNNVELYLLKEDWDEAILKCNPSSYRSLPNQPAPLPRSLLPLLGECYQNAMDFFHYRLNMIQKTPDIRRSPPTLWLQGDPGPAMSALESAILQGMGVNQVVSLDLPSLQSSTFSLDFALARKLEIIPTNSTTYTTSVIYIPCGPTWVEEVGPFMNLITNALSQPTHRSHIFMLITGSQRDCQILVDYLDAADIRIVTYSEPTLQQLLEFLGSSYKHLDHPDQAKPSSNILPEMTVKAEAPTKATNDYPDPDLVRAFRFFRQEAVDLIDSMMKRKNMSLLVDAPKQSHFIGIYEGPTPFGLRNIKEELSKNEIICPSQLSNRFSQLYEQTSFCYRTTDTYMLSLSLGLRFEIDTFAKLLDVKLVNKCETLKKWIQENQQPLMDNKIDVFSIRLTSHEEELANQISHPKLAVQPSANNQVDKVSNHPSYDHSNDTAFQHNFNLLPDHLKCLSHSYLKTIFTMAKIIQQLNVDQILKLLDNPILKSADNPNELLRSTFKITHYTQTNQ